MKAKPLLAGLVGLLLALTAACQKTPDAKEAGTDGAADDMTLRVVQSSSSVAFFPLFVASEERYYAKEGLKVDKPVIVGGDSKVAAALAGGSADIGGGVATTAFLLADGKRDPRIVANLVNSYYVDVIVGKQFQQPGEGASLEDKIKALKGARVGIPAPSGGGVALLQFLFNKVGLDVKKDVTLVNLGASNAGALGALKTDRVNVLIFFQPVSQEVEAQKAGSIYISPTRGDVPDMSAQPHGLALSTGDILKRKPAAMSAFVRAIAQAEKLIHDDPQKTRQLFQKYQSSLDPKTVAAMLPVLQAEIPTAPVMTEDGYAKAVKFHQVAGLAKNPPEFATITGDDFISKALAK
ncbi:ABC transporter substrate-binding protein [Kribbella sp. VKM Ac-2568]|uniref:ABC transporter substrate-binding protein n=1 Tax=Kribbella sp. VKM Ac-2568 TaxID=2512219 RepID=UPI0010458128|nr:ABC transporter substrate-binding protein [Kribbella sp. VKM Ac-2568]TCM42485.1 ABC-type nitrate/sulfonate/bicarbonate transport system substrate-binding protein [Kribbella sp. VKM Ac-2568]